MQTITRANDLRISTRKVRLVADAIRGLPIAEVQDALLVVDQRGAGALRKVLNAAIANAVNNSKLEKSNLIIKAIDINEGTALKRYHPSTRGRVHPYKKRSTNIRIVLEERSEIRSTKSETNPNVQNDKSQKSKIFGKEEAAEKPKSE